MMRDDFLRDGDVFQSPTLDRRHGPGGWIVTRAGLEGGGIRGDIPIPFPDGWLVRAQRLEPDGSYDPYGTKVEFYQSGIFPEQDMLRDACHVWRSRVTFA